MRKMINDKSFVVLAFLCATLCFGLMTGFGQATASVSMTNELTFEPENVLVSIGGTVTWTNTSSVEPHTATGDEPNRPTGFNSGSLPRKWMRPGESFEFTFTSAGVFHYHCVLHQSLGMVGTVSVRGTTTSSQYFFTAAPLEDEGQVLVQWNVAHDKLRVGFNVLRSTGWDQQFVQVNNQIIKATPGARGDEFRFVDNTIPENTKYFYIAEEVRLDGKEAFRGPAIANAR